MAKQINKVVLSSLGLVILVLVLGGFLPPPPPPTSFLGCVRVMHGKVWRKNSYSAETRPTPLIKLFLDYVKTLAMCKSHLCVCYYYFNRFLSIILRYVSDEIHMKIVALVSRLIPKGLDGTGTEPTGRFYFSFNSFHLVGSLSIRQNPVCG